MATITQTPGVWSSRSAVALTRTTLTGADSLAHQRGRRQVLVLSNSAGASATVTLTGTAPTTLSVPGYGLLSTAAGKVVAVAANSVTFVPLDSVWAFLTGTGSVAVTGGAGMTAYLYALGTDHTSTPSDQEVSTWNDLDTWNDSDIWVG